MTSSIMEEGSGVWSSSTISAKRSWVDERALARLRDGNLDERAGEDG